MRKITEKQKYWSEQLLKADEFEGSLTQCAQAQSIPVQTLYYWRSYFKRSSAIEPKTKPVFAQVVSAPAMGSCIRLQLGNVQLHFARLPDPHWLSEFIAASHTS